MHDYKAGSTRQAAPRLACESTGVERSGGLCSTRQTHQTQPYFIRNTVLKIIWSQSQNKLCRAPESEGQRWLELRSGSESTPTQLTLFRLYRTVPFRVSSETRSVNIQPTCTTKEIISSLSLKQMTNVSWLLPRELSNSSQCRTREPALSFEVSRSLS